MVVAAAEIEHRSVAPLALLEGIAVVAFDRASGAIEPDLPPVASGPRWEESIGSIAEAYSARFEEI